MAAPAKLPEFKGKVTAVFIENYWDHQLSELSSRMGKVNAKRRSLGNDKTLSAEERRKLVEAYKADLFTKEEIRIPGDRYLQRCLPLPGFLQDPRPNRQGLRRHAGQNAIDSRNNETAFFDLHLVDVGRASSFT